MSKPRMSKKVGAIMVATSILCTQGIVAFAETGDDITSSSVSQVEQSKVEQSEVVSEKSDASTPPVSQIEQSEVVSEKSEGGGVNSQDTSKSEQEGSKYPTENVVIKFGINLGSPIVSSTNNYVGGNFSLSEEDIVFRVTDKSGKHTYGSFTVSDKNLTAIDNNMLLSGFTVKVPSWTEGDTYKIEFEQLPEFFDSKSCELNYAVSRPESEEASWKEKVCGVDIPVWGILNSDSRTVVIKAQTMTGESIPNALVRLKITGAEESTKGIDFEKSIVTDKHGYAYYRFPNEDKYKGLLSIVANLETSTDTETGSKAWTAYYDYLTRSPITIGVVSTTMTVDAYKSNIPETKEVATLTAKATFKSVENMDLFVQEPVSVTVYSEDGNTVIGSIDLSNEKTSDSLSLIKGSKYQIKISKTGSYACSVKDTSITMTENKVLNLEFVPQIFLKVYKERSGVQDNVNIKITIGSISKEYSNQPVRTFAVNAGSAVTIIDNDNDELYSVLIPDKASTTKMNLATGSLGVNFEDNDSDVVGDDTDTVPQTGDITPYILGGLALGVVGCFGGWIYYKKKGDKYNESRK